MKILVIKQWALGDIIMTTPVLRALCATYKDCRITYLTDSRYASALHGHPFIDTVIPFESVRWRAYFRYGNFPAYLRMSRALRADLNARKFDIIINFTAEKWWALWFLCAPRRIGLYPNAHPNWTRRFYTDIAVKPGVTPLHTVDQNLAVCRSLGCQEASRALVLGSIKEDEIFISSFSALHNIRPTDKVAILTPFSTEDNRSISPLFAADIVNYLNGESHFKIILCVSSQDDDKAEIIVKNVALSVILAGKTTLREYLALVQRSDLVITCDSSPMHVAGAYGTRYLALFGPIPAIERIPPESQGIALDVPNAIGFTSQSMSPERISLADLPDVITALETLVDICGAKAAR